MMDILRRKPILETHEIVAWIDWLPLRWQRGIIKINPFSLLICGLVGWMILG